MRVLLLYLLTMEGVTREHRAKMVNTAGLSERAADVLQAILELGFIELDASAQKSHITRVPAREQDYYR